MAEQLDLKALERKAWRSMHEDGFWELLFGLLMFAGFTRGLTGEPLVGIATIAGAVLVFFLGKRLVTLPRMGRVTFGPERTTKRRRTMLVIVVALLVTVLVYAVAVTGVLSRGLGGSELINLGVSFFLFSVFAAMAHFMDLPRMYLIGAVFATTNLAEGYLDTPLVPLIAAVLILVPGVVLLVRFLRRYPRSTEPGGNRASAAKP